MSARSTCTCQLDKAALASKQYTVEAESFTTWLEV